MSDGDDGKRDMSFSPKDWNSTMDALERGMGPKGLPVSNSDELTRIINLPRRPVVRANTPTAEAMIQIAMQKYSRGPRACRCRELDKDRPCLDRFLWIQAWALFEMEQNSGLIANIAVGAGKCVDARTEIFDYKLGRRRTVDEPGALRVASFDRTLRVEDATAFPSGEKRCSEVVLRDGTKLIASNDHPVLTGRGWVHAAELTSEDFVAVPRAMPEPEAPAKTTNEEVAFVAYMLSDGGCNGQSLHFTNADEAVIDDWQRCSESLGYTVVERSSRSKAREFSLKRGVRDRSRRWAILFDKCSSCGEVARRHVARGLCTRCISFAERGARVTAEDLADRVRERWDLHGLAKIKRLHPDLWGLPPDQVALFLNRFWACDGYITDRGAEIVLASEAMIDDLKFMLLRLGIRGRKRYKASSYQKSGVKRTFNAWRLSVSGADAVTFFERVGDVLGKELACQRVRAKLSCSRRNPNLDIVPIRVSAHDEICNELGIAGRTGVGRERSRGLRRTAIRKFLWGNETQYASRERFVQFCREWNYTGKYAALATSDVAWERVTSVTDAGVRPVFDLNVPSTHNFVANGMVVHNTVLNLTAPLAVPNCKLALVLIPASLVQQIQDDYEMLAEHMRVPGLTVHLPGNKSRSWAPGVSPSGAPEPTLHVLPYTKLSSIKSSDWIERLQPDLVIADECDAMKDMSSARSLRLLRAFDRFPDMRFCGWTGSLADSSVKEFSHLAAVALRYGSPLPVHKQVIDEWSQALDAVPNPAPMGALIRLLEPHENITDVRTAFRRRMAETPGFMIVEGGSNVVTTDGERVRASIQERSAPKIPEIVEEALRKVRDFCRPDTLGGSEQDEILVDKLEQARCVREVATGMFYRWTFPPINGVPQQRTAITEWYAARKEWNSELRSKMMRGELQLDSPKLCENAAKRAWGDHPKNAQLPDWEAEAWPHWRDVMHTVTPKPEAVRLSSFLVDDVVTLANEKRGAPRDGAIIWYAMREFAEFANERARELYGLDLPIYGEGSGSSILGEDGSRTILASIKSHGRGRDKLQYRFASQHLAQSPASGRMFEQVLGRLVRRGQTEATVHTSLYLHTPELRSSFEQALRRAEFALATLGAEQVLLDGWQGGSEYGAEGDDEE